MYIVSLVLPHDSQSNVAPAVRAVGFRVQPLIYAFRMKTVLASWQYNALLVHFKVKQTNRTFAIKGRVLL